MWPPSSSRKSLSAVPERRGSRGTRRGRRSRSRSSGPGRGGAGAPGRPRRATSRPPGATASGSRSLVSKSQSPLPCMIEPSASNSRTAIAHEAWRRRSGSRQLGHGRTPSRRPSAATGFRRPLEPLLDSAAWRDTSSRSCPRTRSPGRRPWHGPLAHAVRGLVDATIRTEVDDAEVRAVTAEVEALTARLRARQLARLVRRAARSRRPADPAVGQRRGRAPQPGRSPAGDDPRPGGRAWSDFTLGAAYEGPPGLVHGGVSALILDQVLGEAAGAGGKPGMTGTLTIRYRRGTRLGALHAEGHIDRVEGSRPGSSARSATPRASRSRPRASSSCPAGRARRWRSRSASSRAQRWSAGTPRTPASVSRASSTAWASSSARRVSSIISRAAS